MEELQLNPIPQKKRKKGWKNFEWGYLLLIPGIGYIVFFILIVSAVMIMQSVGYYNFTGEDKFSLEYWNILLGQQFWDSLRFSLKMGVGSSLTSILICYPLALLLQKAPGKKVLMSIIKMPLFIPSLVGSFLIINIIDYHGILNELLMWLKIIPEPLRLRNDAQGVAVLLIQIWKYVPFQMIIMFSAIEGVRSDVRDAARNLGANSFGVLRHIIFPLTIPSALVAVILVFIKTFNDFAISSTAGPLYPPSLSGFMHAQANTFHEWNISACVGTAMLVAAVLFIVLYTVLGKKIEKLAS